MKERQNGREKEKERERERERETVGAGKEATEEETQVNSQSKNENVERGGEAAQDDEERKSGAWLEKDTGNSEQTIVLSVSHHQMSWPL